MKSRFHPWHLALLSILLCGAAVGLAYWWRASRQLDATGLIECLPPDKATHLYLDVAALRSAGLVDLLAGSRSSEDADYRKFVEQIGFDYRTDLDAVAVAFTRGDIYAVVRGRFSWKQLSDYARAQGGQCRNTVCSMAASQAGRIISFYPLRSGVLALAVSADQRGVEMVGPGQWKKKPVLPSEPVWISAPPFVFSDVSSLPAGTHSFLTPLAQSQGVVFAVGPEGNRFQVRLDVTCATPEAAAALASQLTTTTSLLKKMLERDHMTPNPRDWSGVLVAGTFARQKDHVTGAWPVERGFLEALASGRAQ